jgi:cytochrome d oxidase subunit CydB
MAELWFWLLAGVLAVYAVLDGFDFGVGMLHFAIGKTAPERDTLLRSVGPVWDGNEVWLVAAGGTLFGAFPLLYATAFSGFYLPLMIVLWLLLFRALGIELRHQIDNPLWHQAWDVAFCGASTLLALFFGAALGNLVRGLPLDGSSSRCGPTSASVPRPASWIGTRCWSASPRRCCWRCTARSGSRSSSKKGWRREPECSGNACG